MTERWLPIRGFEFRYEVSSRGRVRRVCTTSGAAAGKMLVGSLGSYGHRKVDLWREGLRTSRRVCDLVALAFRGKPKPGHSVAFRDGRKSNLAAKNITYRKNPRSRT